ncbi:MAG TPA: enediyne biosynthesis protein UnbU [Thermoanaerobaculia bacterium]|nr:enediyne biosynthesis protein UnbU [Thermoanaerobaculia bacterium]
MPPQKPPDNRLAALWRFATAITVFNLLGHTLFGFEQPWATPFIALAASYGTELLLEWADAWAHRRRPRFLGGARTFIEFLLPAHITALAVGMLLYSNASLLPAAFAACAGIASKYVFRVAVAGRTRHFFNPSNFGITVTLLLFHWVGIAAPYMFTENLHPHGDWILPLVLVSAGSFLNTRFTKRVPLIVAWLAAFAAQGLLRSWFAGSPAAAPLLPMTGMAFLLFTFYMVSDPSTTPFKPRSQVLYGVGVAAVYSVLLINHLVFTLFFSLTIVCAVRGLALYLAPLLARQRQQAAAAAPAPLAAAPAPAAAFSEIAKAEP